MATTSRLIAAATSCSSSAGLARRRGRWRRGLGRRPAVSSMRVVLAPQPRPLALTGSPRIPGPSGDETGIDGPARRRRWLRVGARSSAVPLRRVLTSHVQANSGPAVTSPVLTMVRLSSPRTAAIVLCRIRPDAAIRVIRPVVQCAVQWLVQSGPSAPCSNMAIRNSTPGRPFSRLAERSCEAQLACASRRSRGLLGG